MEKLFGFERDGKIYAVPEIRGKIPDDVSEAWLIRHSTVVVELASGRVTKNRQGPITDPRCMTAPPEPPKALELTDRLRLQSATRYSFRGEDEHGAGFAVNVEWESPYCSEGWVITMGEEGVPVFVLGEHSHAPGYYWIPVVAFGDDDTYTVCDIEEEHRALLLALEITQGAVRPTRLKEGD